MTTRFRQLAEEITVTAPTLPPGFFDRARRARRRRHALAAGVAVLLVALASLGLLITPTPEPPVAPLPSPARFPLPSSARVPYQMADVRQAPIAQALYIADADDKLVLFSPDNKFRELPREVYDRYWLSPDGTRLALQKSDHSFLLDISTGDQHVLEGRPLTWSSDGSELAIRTANGVQVLEVATMIVRFGTTGPHYDKCPDMQVILSPDAGFFAALCSNEIGIYSRTGRPLDDFYPVAAGYRFAGDRAWSPFASKIMLQPGDSDHVHQFDLSTHTVSTEDPFQLWRPTGIALPAHIADWWQGNPVLSGDDPRIVTIAQRPQPVQVYSLGWGIGPQVATAIVDWSHTGPPAQPDPGPLPQAPELEKSVFWDSHTGFLSVAFAVVLIMIIAAVIIAKVRGVGQGP